ANQKVAAEGAEVGRSHREAPRRVQRCILLAAVDHAGDELAVRRELVDVRLTGNRHVILLRIVLLRVRDEDVAAERLDPERREALWDLRVPEAARRRYRVERRVEDVDVP